MNYFKTLKVYKASNVEFYPETITAYSYGWWRFVDTYKGKILFNNCRYSPTTNRHQSKVESLMGDLGIKIHIKLHYTRKGFQTGIEEAIKDEIECLKEEIQNLEALIKNPRTKKQKNNDRKIIIGDHLRQIKIFKDLLGENYEV